MFKTSNGKLDWFKILGTIAFCAIIITAIVVPTVSFIKANLPAVEEAAETAAALIH